MPERSPKTAEQDARVVDMRKAGLSFREIGDTLGMTQAGALKCFRRGVAAIPREAAEEMRVLSQGRQEFVTREMIRVMTSFHPVVNNGHVMMNPDTGEMIDDPMPKIAAAKILMTVDERFARLYGLDAPKTTVKIEVDAIDAEIRKLEKELGQDLPGDEGGVEDHIYRHKRPAEYQAIEAPKRDERRRGYR